MTKDEIEAIVLEYLTENAKDTYTYLSDVPEWARPTVQKLVDKGYLVGDKTGSLDLDYSTLRVLVVNDRAGLYD